MTTSSQHIDTEMLGQELTRDEERVALEDEVKRHFNISLAEFERRWHGGEYRDSDDPRVTSLGALLH